MKGIVFNLLENVVTQAHGDATWDALLDHAGLEGAYTSLGSYPDRDLEKLVEAASQRLGLSGRDVVRWFGRRALPLLYQQYPQFFAGHDSMRSFLLTLNDVIHPEVRKIYPGADVPVFDYDVSSDDHLLLGYRSARGLCAFGEGLIEGAAAHFGESVEIDQPECLLRGDDKCLLRVRTREKSE